MRSFIRYTIIYVCITVLTSVGVIFLEQPSVNSSDVIAATPSVEENTAFDNLLSGVMSAKGFDLSLNTNILSEDGASYLLNGKVYLDISSGFENISAQGDLIINDNLQFGITYQNGWLYISVSDNKFRIQTSSIQEIINLITNLLDDKGVDFSYLTTNIKTNIDLDKLNVTDLLQKLQDVSDEVIENGHLLRTNLLGLDIEVKTDNDFKINSLTTSEILFNGFAFVPNISLTYVEEPRAIELDENEFLDISSSTELIEAVVNTCTLTDYHITANLNMNMRLSAVKNPISMNIPLDVKIKIVDDKPEIMARIGAIPVIAPVDNDVPYKVGDTVSGVYCGLDRILNIYYKDGYIYFYRSEIVPVVGKNRTYEKMYKTTIDEFMRDPMILLSYGFGFKDIVMNEIEKSVDLAMNRDKPIDYTNVLLGFSHENDMYSFVMNLKELANNPKLDTMNLGFSTEKVNGKPYITSAKLKVNMPISDVFTIDIESNDIRLNSIGESLDWSSFDEFITNYPYKTDEKWHASKGNWELVSATTYTVAFEENGGEEVPNVIDAVGTEFDLPILPTRVEDNGERRDTFTFAGWFSSNDFIESNRVIVGRVQRGDTTLYAKWDVKTELYYDVIIVNELSNENITIHALAGSEMNIATQLDDIVISTDDKTTTYAFVGWYTDAQFTNLWTGGQIVPNYNVTLHAKWDIIDVVETRKLNVYDNGLLISSTAHEVGKELLLPDYLHIYDSTRFYLDENYSVEYVLPEYMPNESLDLHIRNIYTVKIVDSTCNNETIILTGYQGENITLPNNYATVVLDDGTQTKKENYIFKGFDTVISEFANQDLIINVEWDYDVKYYYDVTFNKDNNVISAYKKHIDFPISILRVLEGTIIDLSKYIPTWKYTTGIGILTVNWYHKFEGWSTKMGGDNITELVVTGNTDIYANWSGLPESGKS